MLIIEPNVLKTVEDFFESFNSLTWEKQGLPSQFVQDNQSFS
jgi:dTDP-4-dehydrorhamnose 3,5-epimerase-like enzyme